MPPATLHPLYLLTMHILYHCLLEGPGLPPVGHLLTMLTILTRSNDIYQVLQGPGVPPVDVLCGTLEICSYAASVVRDGRLAPATFR